MAVNDLKKLGRRDLLDMLLEISKENEELRQRLTEAEEKLKKREIIIEDSESLAEACLRMSGVLEALETACVEYKSNSSQSTDQETEDTPEKVDADIDLTKFKSEVHSCLDEKLNVILQMSRIFYNE